MIKSLTVTVKDPVDLITNVSDLYSINYTQQSTQTASIGQSLTLNLSINIPPYSNCRTKLVFSCVDNLSARQFCHINSIKIVSFGKNVDGLQNEYLNNLILPLFDKTAMTYYNDSASLDLGIVTNTRR